MIRVAEHEILYRAVKWGAQVGGLQALLPVKMVGAAAAGEAYRRRSDLFYRLYHVAAHTVEIVARQKRRRKHVDRAC